VTQLSNECLEVILIRAFTRQTLFFGLLPDAACIAIRPQGEKGGSNLRCRRPRRLTLYLEVPSQLE
jgi:hypothetical protein